MNKTVKIITIALSSLFGVALLFVLILGVLFLIANKTNGSLESSGEKRQYLLYVPASYDPDTPTPLIISIHGYADWPARQQKVSRWNDLADEQGFIVVYPSGTDFPKHWRTRGFAHTKGDPQMDVQFISDLIDKLESEYNIDPARIYVNGFSNGGGMSYLLACTLSERIAAIGSVSGAYTYPIDLCNPSRPVPLIAFHGDADPVVPYLGGPSRSFDIPFPSVPDWMQGWADRNQCKIAAPIARQGDVGGSIWSECSQNADLIFYTIGGGGHAWPGSDPSPDWIVGKTSQQIDATRVIWQFFEQHPLK